MNEKLAGLLTHLFLSQNDFNEELLRTLILITKALPGETHNTIAEKLEALVYQYEKQQDDIKILMALIKNGENANGS